MDFYLGTHMEGWLRDSTVPLFVSHRRLVKRKTLPIASHRWACDSGGFSELSLYGRWVTTEEQYVKAIARYKAEVGLLDWAAPMDWMCEPFMLERTGLSVREHQRRTVTNFLSLRSREEAIVPVLQGWIPDDYLRHVEDYERAGVDLTQEQTVGVGSVCRRQNLGVVQDILLKLQGLRLHGFGFKLQGLKACADLLTSADSMAWSYNARRNPSLPGHTHKSCANCKTWALAWRKRALQSMDNHQMHL